MFLKVTVPMTVAHAMYSMLLDAALFPTQDADGKYHQTDTTIGMNGVKVI
jgi:hypothetical protein